MNVFLYGFKKFWLKRMPLALVGYICSFLAIICDLLLPLLGADILNYYFVDKAAVLKESYFTFIFSGASSLSELELFKIIALTFIALVAFRLVLIYIKNVSMQWNGLDMENELRKITYEKLLELDCQTLSAYNTGELLTVMNRDVIMSKEMYSRGMLNYFDSAVVMAVSSVILVGINPLLLLVPVAIAPFFIVSLIRYVKEIHRVFSSMRDHFSALNLSVQENIHAVRIVRSFSNEEREVEKFKDVTYKLRNVYFDFDIVWAKYNAKFDFYMQMAYAISIGISAFLALNGMILVGTLSAATAYVLKIMNHISQVSQNTGGIQRQFVSMERLKKFIETESKILPYPETLNYSGEPNIKINNLSLTLGDKQVLKDINLDIPYGKKVGIMGGTGSGKSVLLKCFARIFDATLGDITVNGENIKNMNIEELRNEFAYVFQDVFLFSHTVDANIAFYDDTVEMDEVERAAAISQAKNFIEKLEDGYQTVIGERGLGLSGGQKQRISIARALMKNAPVLILDDASSALDMATERKVLNGIKEAYPNHTLLISAHRVSSVADCDEIIYMQDGEIIERGTLKELVKLNGKFAEIYRLQSSDGQLDDSSYGASEIEKEGGEL